MPTSKPFRAKAVLFDFDGTLTAPGALDFRVIKKEIGCPQDMPVLEFIEELKDAYKAREIEKSWFAWSWMRRKNQRPTRVPRRSCIF